MGALAVAPVTIIAGGRGSKALGAVMVTARPLLERASCTQAPGWNREGGGQRRSE